MGHADQTSLNDSTRLDASSTQHEVVTLSYGPAGGGSAGYVKRTWIAMGIIMAVCALHRGLYYRWASYAPWTICNIILLWSGAGCMMALWMLAIRRAVALRIVWMISLCWALQFSYLAYTRTMILFKHAPGSGPALPTAAVRITITWQNQVYAAVAMVYALAWLWIVYDLRFAWHKRSDPADAKGFGALTVNESPTAFQPSSGGLCGFISICFYVAAAIVIPRMAAYGLNRILVGHSWRECLVFIEIVAEGLALTLLGIIVRRGLWLPLVWAGSVLLCFRSRWEIMRVLTLPWRFVNSPAQYSFETYVSLRVVQTIIVAINAIVLTIALWRMARRRHLHTDGKQGERTR